MKIVICIIAIVGLLAGVVSTRYGARIIAAKYPEWVGERRLETGNILKPSYNEAGLREWVKGNKDAAAFYAAPVLIPVDILFAIFFGTLCAVLSATALGLLGVSTGCLILSLVLPLLFVAADVSEDLFLARMLMDSTRITADAVLTAQWITSAKLLTFFLASLETLGVWLWVLFAWWRGTPLQT
jgi:hypothetical protein